MSEATAVKPADAETLRALADAIPEMDDGPNAYIGHLQVYYPDLIQRLRALADALENVTPETVGALAVLVDHADRGVSHPTTRSAVIPCRDLINALMPLRHVGA